MRSTLSLLIVVSAAVGAFAQAQNPASALKIVVIRGEDAVNIIQQKTAVAPVIEVRDRNNLPVPGVTVTFSVAHGATFGGAPTLTVVTNAAGQAAATGFTPTAAGAIQIQATAAFQGQTVAATITQSNVMTAAQAAAAGGGGGGMSGTLIGVIAAVGGGGAIAATQLGKKEATSTSSSSPTSTTSTTTTTSGPTPTAPPSTPTPTTPAPTPQPTSASYSGDLSGQSSGPNSLNVDGRGNVVNCTAMLSEGARVRLNVVTQSNGDVTGTISFEGTLRDAVEDCTTFHDQPWPFSISGAVTGTSSNLRFRADYHEGGPHPLLGSTTYSLSGSASFSGSVSGNTVTGVFVHVMVIDVRGPNYDTHTELSANIPVTLNKS